MTINLATLVAAGIAPTQARLFAEPLASACERFGIATPVREAAFVAQCAHESEGFTRLEESLYYRRPERVREMWPGRVRDLVQASRLVGNPQGLANWVYSSRNGNGDVASGDGWRYRGRGLLQLTGRANYSAAAAAIGRPYLECPDLVAEPWDACATAAWFFTQQAGCLPLADASDTAAITRRINGPGMVGLADRRQRFEQAVQAFAGAAA
jgi:putative chitinase